MEGNRGPAAPAPAAGSSATPRRRYENSMQQPQPQKEKEIRKIHVTGYPPYTQPQDIVRAFSKFGNVRIDRITNKFCYLSFATEAEAKAAVDASKKINIYGEFLVIKPYIAKQAGDQMNRHQIPKREFPKTKQKGIIVDPFHIDLSGDFHQQLDTILASVRLTQEEATAISGLYADVEKVLQTIWPGCVAMPFGSITTGLGIKTSDADCYVHIPPHLNSGLACIAKAKRALQAYPHLFTEILAIPRANTPLIKFFHVPTNTNCDLSFKTPLGHQNSKLIAFLLQSNPRLIPMAVAIKYWAKVHGLSGTGKLTNYALTMMIIFYLQQPPISLLPSVEWLQRDHTNDVIVDYWNTGFMSHQALLPQTSNDSSIAELVGGFFEYYSMFNFDEMIVCPFMGTPMQKELFKDLSQLPPQFERYKQNVVHNVVMPMRVLTPMCVQDPFEQSHNVASAVSSRMANEIKAFFKFAANAYEKEKMNKCQDFLKSILLQKPKIVRAKTHPEFRVNLFPRMITNIINPDWKSVVKEIIFIIFEKMLKLTLGKVEEKLNTESKKEKEKYLGVVTKSIWKRKQSSRKYEMCANMELQEKQAKITEEILKSENKTYYLQFQMTVTYAHEPKSAVVAIKLAEGEVEPFKDFGKFFISVMQGWFMALLKPYTRPSEIDMAAKIAETIKYLDSNLDIHNGVVDSDDDDDDDKCDRQLIDKNDEQMGNQDAEEMIDKSEKQMTDKIDIQIIGKSDERIIDKSDKLMDTDDEQMIHKNDEQMIDKSDERIIDKSDKLMDTNDEQMIDNNDKQIIDTDNEQMIDKNEKRMTDKNGEQMIDKNDKQIDKSDKQMIDTNDEQIDKSDKQMIGENDEQIIDKKDIEMIDRSDKQIIDKNDKGAQPAVQIDDSDTKEVILDTH